MPKRDIGKLLHPYLHFLSIKNLFYNLFIENDQGSKYNVVDVEKPELLKLDNHTLRTCAFKFYTIIRDAYMNTKKGGKQMQSVKNGAEFQKWIHGESEKLNDCFAC